MLIFDINHSNIFSDVLKTKEIKEKLNIYGLIKLKLLHSKGNEKQMKNY